eukprot:TRINITY_DN8701_c0_g3_i1.p1 TRINITY_DN8701_c0_g3~~TRINITY_DN8701_c0_g3_i1.p1  ORF type:complete len:308 (+),score=37.47 TRINITY_DN8701_c0_g3_i1:339-1262(+)
MLVRGGPSGFVNAPVSKLLVLGTGGASLLASVFKSHAKLHLSVEGLTRGQLWRLVTSQLVFTSPSEILFGLMALYSFRVFERQRGSNKYAMFTAFTSIVASMVQLGTLVMFPRAAPIAPGPYPFIFAGFALFYYDVPTTYHFKVMGLTLPDKIFTYLLGAELMFNVWPYGFYASLSGLVAGALYNTDILGISSKGFPSPIRRFFARFVLPLLDTSPSPRAPRGQRQPAGGRRPGVDRLVPQPGMGMGMGGGGGGGVPAPPRAPAFEPSEGDITQLTDMGFPRDAAVRALVATSGNVAAATNMLLDSN